MIFKLRIKYNKVKNFIYKKLKIFLIKVFQFILNKKNEIFNL